MSESILPAPSAELDHDLRGIREWVRERLGIRFEAAQLSIFKTRMAMFNRARKLTAAETLGLLQQGDTAVMKEVAETVSTNFTAFFREPEMFDFLTSTILPSLPKAAPLRLWSAASSSGEEAYSMAHCVREALGSSRAASTRILGTDISDRQIRQAEAALYPRATLGKLSSRAQALLTPAGDSHMAVTADARSLCTFRRMNLTQPTWPFTSRFHVIFLRNVLYYFEPPMQTWIVEQCYDAVEPGGWLVTSLTEPMLDLRSRWTRQRPSVLRRDA